VAPRDDVRVLMAEDVGMDERLVGLSSREQELVEVVTVGNVLECSQLPREQLAATEDPQHIIRAEVLRDVLLERYSKPLDPRGIRLRGARIIGTLDLIHIQTGIGIELRNCFIDQTMLLAEAHLPWLTLSGSCVPTIQGDGLRIDGALLLSEGFGTTGGSKRGAVQLREARIGSVLDLSGAVLTNPDGVGLDGDGLRIDGSLCLRWFRATGRGEYGAVQLSMARIGGVLDLSGAVLINPDGPALDGDGLQVDGALFLSKGFRATGRGEGGAMRLLGAHGGVLDLSGAVLINPNGPALVGDGLQLDGPLFLSEGFRATGHGEHGTVRLQSAHIGEVLDLSGAELTNPDGLVLDLYEAKAKQVLLLPQVICPCTIAGKPMCSDTKRRIELAGFVYTGHKEDWKQWLHVIVQHTEQYCPQPYQQLAAVQRAAGHDSDAREILIAQQQDLHERGSIGGWVPRTVHFLWGALGGYGYRTSRLALALLVALTAAGGLGVFAGHIPTSPGRYVAMHTPQTATPNTTCSLIEQIGIGIERSLPLATTGIQSRCDFDTASRRGQAVTVASWVLQALVWALATLVVAGYSGLIRKTI
jgi:hypothetical protein